MMCNEWMVLGVNPCCDSGQTVHCICVVYGHHTFRVISDHQQAISTNHLPRCGVHKHERWYTGYFVLVPKLHLRRDKKKMLAKLAIKDYLPCWAGVWLCPQCTIVIWNTDIKSLFALGRLPKKKTLHVRIIFLKRSVPAASWNNQVGACT